MRIVKKLLDVCDFQGGTQPPKEEWISKATNGYVRMLQIRDYSQGAEKFIQYVKDNKSLHKCKEDDIMLSRYGYIGQAFTGLAGAYNVALVKVVKKCNIETQYLLYYFQSDYFKHSLLSNVGARATIPGFNKSELATAQIPVPSTEEQRRISKILSSIDQTMEKYNQQLSALDELIKSRFVEMFGDTVLNPFGWERKLLGEICDVRDGTHDSPQYCETGYPLVTAKNVTGGKIDIKDCSLICEEDFRRINERSKVDMGDIIMPMIGTVGKPVIVDIAPDFAIKNVALIKFKQDSKVLNVYIHALLQSNYFDDAVLSKIRGGTQKFISLGDIRKFKVLVPAMEIQERFSAFVAEVDKSKLAVKQSLEKLETLKKSLMQQYFG